MVLVHIKKVQFSYIVNIVDSRVKLNLVKVKVHCVYTVCALPTMPTIKPSSLIIYILYMVYLNVQTS